MIEIYNCGPDNKAYWKYIAIKNNSVAVGNTMSLMLNDSFRVFSDNLITSVQRSMVLFYTSKTNDVEELKKILIKEFPEEFI